MQNFTTKTIREIALETPAVTQVFEEYKIDFCCGGGHNFYEACQFAGVAPEIVGEKIYQILNNQTDDFESPETKTVSELIAFIIEKHHVFTHHEISRLTALMDKVCHSHDESHLQLCTLQKSFAQLCDDLSHHLIKEETILFPFIKHLEMSEANNHSSPHPPFKTVKNPIRILMIEHDTVSDILRKMREITKDYELPKDACPSFQALYFGLEELEKDLHIHLHLENNVLFPSAVKLEQKVIFGY